MHDSVEDFIARWQGVTASELASAQSFVIDLCRLLDVPAPHPTPEQDYMFERPVSFRHGDGGASPGRIDCYRRGGFVLEAKKLKVGAGGTAAKGFSDAMLAARSQAEGYARALPSNEGRRIEVTAEREGKGEGLEVELAEQRGLIHADLTIGANIAAAQALRANVGVSSPGFKLHGAGFIVTPEERAALEADAPIKDYRNGRDLTDRPRGVQLIDLFGHDADEVRRRWPATYQRVLETVKPERDKNNRASYHDNWWIFGEPRKDLRPALAGLPRYIATVETAKHRVFQFLDAAIAPDNMLICIALDDSYTLGVLSSRVHVIWALAAGGRLGVGNDPRYNKSRCFETFPFPVATLEQQARICGLAEQLDAHRKRVLAAHAELTLTGLYNVLSRVGAGGTAVLTPKERNIYDKGLVAVLKSFHDELDAAVLEAYGWHDQPDDAALLERLVALNAERAAEESQGHIRWLRPEFQAPQQTQAPMEGMGDARPTICDSHEEVGHSPAPPAPWPNTLPEQMAALAGALTQQPQSEHQLATRFTGKGKWKSRLPELLATLATLGRARRLDDGRWMR